MPVMRAPAFYQGLKMNIINEILSLKVRHYECEDSWYSCPKSDYGCCDESKGNECYCGADDKNAKIDIIVEELKKKLDICSM